MKMTVWHFVSDTHKVMTAVIVSVFSAIPYMYVYVCIMLIPLLHMYLS